MPRRVILLLALVLPIAAVEKRVLDASGAFTYLPMVGWATIVGRSRYDAHILMTTDDPIRC
jgi:hypothetical protein